MKDTAGVVYSIPCKDCLKVYIRETERRFGVRETKHRKDMEQLEGVKFTQARKKESLLEIHQSAFMDHASRENYTIDCDNTTLPRNEADWTKRGITEAISIRKAGMHAINHDR